MSDNLSSEVDQKFTIVEAITDTGKKTIEIGEKILEQVQGELGDLLIFQQEHDNCFSDLVKISKTMEGEQRSLTSKVLTSKWDKKQHFLLIAKLQDKLKGMKEKFENEENEYFKTQEEVSNMKIQLNQKQQQLALRKMKSTTPKPSTTKPPTPKRVIPVPSTPKLTKSILKSTTPKRKRYDVPSQSPPLKKPPQKKNDADKTMDTDYDDEDSFWND
uniref:Uncharacterized protein n=1 Tax=Meloidogyne enterolobii TaxID=390850 RepID=A0A6V7UGY2_MELEN|nr:unnamed protein product [Meloidogyne enterolobii]